MGRKWGELLWILTNTVLSTELPCFPVQGVLSFFSATSLGHVFLFHVDPALRDDWSDAAPTLSLSLSIFLVENNMVF